MDIVNPAPVDDRHPLLRELAAAGRAVVEAQEQYDKAKEDKERIIAERTERGLPLKDRYGAVHAVSAARSAQSAARGALSRAEKRLRNATFYWEHRSLPYPEWDEARKAAAEPDDNWKDVLREDMHSTERAVTELDGLRDALRVAAKKLASIPQRRADLVHFAADRNVALEAPEEQPLDAVADDALYALDWVNHALAELAMVKPEWEETPSTRYRFIRREREMATDESPDENEALSGSPV